MQSPRFQQLHSAIDDGIHRQLHTGVQVYVSKRGEVQLDEGFGTAKPGVPMTSSTIMLWRSAGKPLTAVAIMRLVEAGKLSLDTQICEVLPNCDSTVAGQATVKQLLTHTSKITVSSTGWPQNTTAELIQATFQSQRDNSEATAAYQPQITWFVLGEVLRNVMGADTFAEAMREAVLSPIGLADVWCGVPASKASQLNDRLPTIFERVKGSLAESEYTSGDWLTQPSPGGNFRGPISQLGHFYEMLASGGTTQNGVQVLQTITIRNMTTRHRADQFDQTLQHIVDYGLGLIINSNHHGAATVPYGFGKYCSGDSFGHGGAQCSIGFYDPQHELVVAWAANGFCGEGQHQRRNRAINQAIYEDLGLLCDSSNPGTSPAGTAGE